MLTIVSMVFGFLGPFVPEVIKLFTASAERKHELAMMQMRMQQAGQEHLHRMAEIEAQADIAEARELHKPTPSFGVQILDKGAHSKFSMWLLAPVFWAFSVADWITTMVRPGITWAFVGFYGLVKVAKYHILTSGRFQADAWSSLDQLWTVDDWAVLTLVLSYWFGQRAAHRAFGTWTKR